MIRTFSIRVSGKVQGVFFRASAKEKADELGIGGRIRNEHDGSVYIEAQGDEDTLEEFFHWCKQGPSRARVDRCDIGEIEHRDFDGFEIERG
jgi:acylphosphatase